MLFFFWPLYCLSFDLWLLITPLASSDFLLLYCLSFDLWLLIIPLVSSNFFLHVISKDMLIVNISGQLRFELSWQQCFKEIINRIRGWGYGVKRHLQQYFSQIIAVSFIGGGNRSTQRKPQICRKSLKNVIT